MKKKKLLTLLLILIMIAVTGCFTQKEEKQATEKLETRGFASTYATMNIRGTNNNWGLTPMTLTNNNEWTALGVAFGTTTTERFKFDATTNWATNFGDTNKDGVAEQNGSDITVTAGQKYNIVFNDSTKKYTVTKITASLTVSPTSGKTQKGTTFTLPATGIYTNNGTSTSVPLTWTPAVDVTKLGDTIYTATSNGLTVTFTLNVWEPTLTIPSNSSSISKGTAFTLPATGTYTNNGTSTSVPLTWTPALDITKLGETTYSATSNGLTVTYKLTVTDFTPSTYKTMNFRGTPNNWASTPMTLTSAYTWTITNVKTGTTATERFKFDAYGDWKTSFGVNGGNQDIPLEANNTYTITFNDSTKKYTITKVVPQSLTIATTTGRVQKGTAFTLPATGTYTNNGVSSEVALTWTPAVDTTKLGDTVYTGTANGLSVTFTLTVWEPTAPTLTVNPTSSTINKGDVFTLPLGTYTRDGVSSQIALTWTPALDLTKIGATVYTGTANGLSVTYTLTINDYTPSTYKTMNFRGTPNNWVSTPMTLTSAYTWTITNIKTGTTSTERFKFDVYGDWKTSFGVNGGNQDIPLEANSTYTITFNDKTKAYTLNKITVPTLIIGSTIATITTGTAFTLPATGTYTKDGVSSQVALTWTPALDLTKIGTTVYSATSNGLTVTFSLTINEKTLLKTYDQVLIRGTSNNWGATDKMKLVADYIWQIEQTFAGVTSGTNADRFKFDIKGDWTMNFGDNEPNGIADLNATKDIYVTGGAGTYVVTFNDSTKAYSVKVRPTTYSVTYNGNGSIQGTVPVDTNGYISGSTVTVLGNSGNLVKEGNIFDGWNIKQDGSGTSYIFGSTLIVGSTNVVLYAKWKVVDKIETPIIISFPEVSNVLAKLEWTNSDFADSYEIYRSENNIDYVKIGESRVNNFTDSTVGASKAYQYKVKAKSSLYKAESSLSLNMELKTPDSGAMITDDNIKILSKEQFDDYYISTVVEKITLVRNKKTEMFKIGDITTFNASKMGIGYSVMQVDNVELKTDAVIITVSEASMEKLVEYMGTAVFSQEETDVDLSTAFEESSAVLSSNILRSISVGTTTKSAVDIKITPSMEGGDRLLTIEIAPKGAPICKATAKIYLRAREMHTFSKEKWNITGRAEVRAEFEFKIGAPCNSDVLEELAELAFEYTKQIGKESVISRGVLQIAWFPVYYEVKQKVEFTGKAEWGGGVFAAYKTNAYGLQYGIDLNWKDRSHNLFCSPYERKIDKSGFSFGFYFEGGFEAGLKTTLTLNMYGANLLEGGIVEKLFTNVTLKTTEEEAEIESGFAIDWFANTPANVDTVLKKVGVKPLRLGGNLYTVDLINTSIKKPELAYKDQAFLDWGQSYVFAPNGTQKTVDYNVFRRKKTETKYTLFKKIHEEASDVQLSVDESMMGYYYVILPVYSFLGMTYQGIKSDEVWVPDDFIVKPKDPNLEAVLREILKKPTGDLYRKEVERITYLDARNRNIGTLEGLGKIRSIWWWNLSGNQLTNVNGLDSLENCRSDPATEVFKFGLDLSSNKIANTDGLKKFKYGGLNLSNNRLTNIDGLCSIEYIAFLDISYNKLTNIDGLKGLVSDGTKCPPYGSHSLMLNNNEIINIDAIKNIKYLNELGLSNNKLKNVDALIGITEIDRLILENNMIENINGLTNLTKTIWLVLNNNELKNVDGLNGITTVNHIVLDNNQIMNLDGLRNLKNADSISLKGNNIAKADGLTSLSQIEPIYDEKTSLYVMGNPLIPYIWHKYYKKTQEYDANKSYWEYLPIGDYNKPILEGLKSYLNIDYVPLCVGIIEVYE